MYQIYQFLLFIFKAIISRKSSFINKLKITKNPKDFLQFKKIKHEYLLDKTTIKITDFGAGSKHFTSNKRSVNEIAKNAGISNKKAKFLASLCKQYKPQSVLEIGTSVGLATTLFQIYLPKSKITTIEGCPNTATIAKKYFEKNNFNAIELIQGTFNEVLPSLIQKNKFDLIYFDGNHQKKPTLEYFKLCLDHVNENTIFIFDDIYWSKEMKSAWDEIKNHEKATISVDVFYLGIVFFTPQKSKQHYYQFI